MVTRSCKQPMADSVYPETSFGVFLKYVFISTTDKYPAKTLRINVWSILVLHVQKTER